MAILDILQFPDPRLRTVGKKVTHLDEILRRQVDDMYETMYDSKGVGLAATQVNIHQQFFVMDISETRDQRECVINPEVLSQEGVQYESEGCLSVANAYDKVERAAKMRVKYMNLDGKFFEIEIDGLLAICFQHEMDHLNGILFIDHLSRLKQQRIKEKIVKSKR